MLHGEKFESVGYLIYYGHTHDEFYAENTTDLELLRDRPDIIINVQNWLPYKEPEPEFPFKFDELVCVRDGKDTEWRAARYSHISRIPEAIKFRCLGDSLFEEITTFSHDLLGKVVEPTTPVWIVKDGKPCVKN